MAIIIFALVSSYLPIDSWQSEVLEEMQVRGAFNPRFTGIRPYWIGHDDPAVVSQEQKLWQPVFSTTIYLDTIQAMRFKPSFACTWNNFSIMVQPVVKFGDDSLPPDNKFMDLFSSHYERAYIRYESRYVGFFIGRERFAAGPSPRNNLLLSGTSAPMDWIGYALGAKRFKLTFFLSRLDDLLDTKPVEYVNDTITQSIDAQRYLTVKRLDILLSERLHLGCTEAGIFGGENYSLEVYHFNPVVLLQAYQYNWSKDVNFFLQFDAKYFFDNLCIYGALMMDDFQLESDPNNEPHHLAYNIGIEFADPLNLRSTFWMFEYNAVTRFTYTHFIPYQRYQYRGTLIGSPYGPDHDELYGKVVYHATPAWDMYTQASFVRKGEKYIDDPWPIPEKPREPGIYFPDDNFLGGIVQHSVTVTLGARFFPLSWLTGDIMVGFVKIDNYRHVSGEKKTFPAGKAQVHVLCW